MAKASTTTNPKGKRPKKKTPLAKLRTQVSHLAANANMLLKDVREETPEWLWERWDSYLYEHGTKRDNRFRQTTSRMNTEQLKEYKELLISFYEDIEEQREMYNTYAEHFEESDTAFLFRISKEAKSLYFRYFPPSEKEAEAFKETVRSSVWTRLHDREYMETHDRLDIYNEMIDALHRAGDVRDPKQGDITKFRDIFTTPEFIYQGRKVRRRML